MAEVAINRDNKIGLNLTPHSSITLDCDVYTSVCGTFTSGRAYSISE
jgi:hypothetical protein